MGKLNEKVLKNHPELGPMLQNIEDKKEALNNLKHQRKILQADLKTAEKDLKKYIKALPKTKKKAEKAKAAKPEKPAKSSEKVEKTAKTAVAASPRKRNSASKPNPAKASRAKRTATTK